MVLLAHMIFGAAIGSAVKSIPTAIVLAFLSHYFLDSLPHIEYNVENIKSRQWHNALPDILKVVLDFCLSILLISIFSNSALPAGRQVIIYICAFSAVLPDGFTLLNYITPNKILDGHYMLHEKIHFLKNKKLSKFWRAGFQVLIVIFSILLLAR